MLLGVLAVCGVVALMRVGPRALHPDKENPTLRQAPDVPGRERVPTVNGSLHFDEGSTNLSDSSEKALLRLRRSLPPILR